MAPPEPISQAEILRQIQAIMKELFELAQERVQPEAKLVDDLELDSLDALDLAVKVEESTGHAFDEAKLRSLRTIQDVIDALSELLASGGAKVAVAAKGEASEAASAAAADS